MRVNLPVAIIKPLDMNYQDLRQHAYPLLLIGSGLLLTDLTSVHILLVQLLQTLQHLQPLIYRLATF
jgi:hypothetical protein